MNDDTSYPRGTTEYVKTTVTADVELTQTVAIAVGDIDPITGTWLPAQWVGDEWTTLDPDAVPSDPGAVLHHRKCRTSDSVAFVAPTYPQAGQYAVGVKVIDTSETPIMLAGWITLV